MVAPSIERQTVRLAGILGRTPSVVQRRMHQALRRAGDAHLAAMNTRMRGPEIRTRSGALRQSFGKRIEKDGNGLAMFLFSTGVPYANQREFGGPIVPKPPRKYLTIPLDDNLTAAGVPRFPSAKALMDDASRDTFVFKGPRTGNLFIVEKTADDLKFLFRLVPRVQQQGNLGWRETWKQGAANRRALYDAAVSGSIDEARR